MRGKARHFVALLRNSTRAARRVSPLCRDARVFILPFRLATQQSIRLPIFSAVSLIAACTARHGVGDGSHPRHALRGSICSPRRRRRRLGGGSCRYVLATAPPAAIKKYYKSERKTKKHPLSFQIKSANYKRSTLGRSALECRGTRTKCLFCAKKQTLIG